MHNLPIEPGSLLFAPMEGITDQEYRQTILDLYPEWDYMATDFLRCPSVGLYPTKHVLSHFGNEAYNSPVARAKTIYQILTTADANTLDTIEKITSLGFNWLDINLGCPSKTVCKNKGGSFLLSELDSLQKIIELIRTNFTSTFTAKIRVGYRDDSLFTDILSLLEDAGVDAITIHARTRDELYKGVARWEYVARAVEHVQRVPIIGNGDIWTTEDVTRYFEFTKCHSIMIARGALKTPWLARLHKTKQLDSEELRRVEIKKYFSHYYSIIDRLPQEEAKKVRRLKAASRYIFDDLSDGAVLKKRFLLSKTKEEMFGVLSDLS